jgi:hypothetical protein
MNDALAIRIVEAIEGLETQVRIHSLAAENMERSLRRLIAITEGRSRVVSQAASDLKAHTDPLAASVASNQPISGTVTGCACSQIRAEAETETENKER